MRLASIVPVKNIDRTFDGPYAMLLAHLKDYYPVNTNKNCYTIMDNSLIELGGSVSMEYLIEAADKLHPDEIILPDVYCKGAENYASVINSIAWLSGHNLLGKYRLMAVCHAEDPITFAYYFRALCNIPEITTIGIPKVTSKLFKDIGGRPALEWLWQHNCTKQIHLLGCWETLSELLEYKNPALIRSVDTCIPALLSKGAVCGYAWSKRPDKTIDLLNDEIGKDAYEDIMMQLWEKNL